MENLSKEMGVKNRKVCVNPVVIYLIFTQYSGNISMVRFPQLLSSVYHITGT